MEILQQITEGEAAPKRKGRRMRKREWREKWLVMSEGSTLSDRAIKQIMRGPKLLSTAMPRVILKEQYLQRPRSAESEFGLKWRGPKKHVNRRVKQRRKQDWGPPITIRERRVLNRRSRSQPKKRKASPLVGWDGLNHNGIVVVREFTQFDKDS